MIRNIPEAWTESGGAARLLERLLHGPSVLMLDYDGTLAPFHADRLQAHPYPGVRERLELLLGANAAGLVLISGRKAHELQSLIGLGQPVEIWGSHGREHLAADGSYAIEALTGWEQGALDVMREKLGHEYSAEMLEAKPNSIAIHWRNNAAEKGQIQVRVRQLYDQLNLPGQSDGKLQLLAFDGGVELRAGDVNKGDAVRRVLSTMPVETFAAFLGDDTTDEDGFEVLRSAEYVERNLTVLVGNEPRESTAEFFLRAPEELLPFLDAWIAGITDGAAR